jgi:hypothetical protein
MTTLLLTLALFAVAMLVMAVGVIFRRPCLRGSCGGPEILDGSGEPLTCATCPNREKRREEAAAGTPLPVVGDGG